LFGQPVAEWQDDATAKGPQYFCLSPANSIATLSDSQLNSSLRQLQAYELVAAPAAASWLMLLVLLSPAFPYLLLRSRRAGKARAAALDNASSAISAWRGTFRCDRILSITSAFARQVA
jgi:hypothetical protein